MDALESNILRILEGRSYRGEDDDDQNDIEEETEDHSWCDYSLKEQIDELSE